MKFPTVFVTDEMRMQALERSRLPFRRPVFGKEGFRTEIGFLGELAAESAMTKLKIPFVHIGGRTHDYQILGHKFEVKTQNCSTYPQPHYDCDVADHNYEKQVVNYIFTRARSEGHVAFESYHTVYIVGCCTRLMFEEHCAHKRQDEISNKLKFHNPCRTIEIKRLKPLHLLPTLLEEPCNRSSL